MRKRIPLVLFLAFLLLFSSCQKQERLHYPAVKKGDVVDDYFGTKVADPYRWLEDDNSLETAKWVEEENKITFGYLAKIPYRRKVRERLEELYNYARYSAPFRRGEYFFFTKNDGLQNQDVYYIQKGLDGKPEVFLDPNQFSTDGTARLGAFAVSKDARYAAYGISRSGSDWQDYYVMEAATKQQFPEVLNWVKVSGLSWQGHGFYYSRYPAPANGKELTSKNEDHKVYYHKVGTPQSKDQLIYEYPQNSQRFNIAQVTKDERYLILNVSERGQGKRGNALYYRDLSKGEKTFTPIVGTVGDDTYSVVDNVGEKLLVQTNHNAPKGRVFLFDPKHPEEKNWKDILPEKPEPLEEVSAAGGKLFAEYMKDVTTRAYVYSLEGTLENEIKLPALGTAGGFEGLQNDTFAFYTFSTFNFPPTIYRYDIPTQESTLFRVPEIPHFKSTDYETRQVFYKSKDGTRIPMFIVYKKGIQLNGNNPALLTGYGGFDITWVPYFDPLRLTLLEQGFVYAEANLRGGGEYGEQWHIAGTKVNKQNVFDDFVAAAEYLIANHYTSPQKLAIQGASNGGLLVGAVLNQRPELFEVAIAQAGVMDMLRFHKFTIGWNWIADYGSSNNEAEFEALYKYSPLQNVRARVKYPAELITTADHDDRVVPAHSFKYAATLQEKTAGTAPILIRIETKSGHGASNTTKRLEETADIDAFIFYNLGVAPKY